jgi:hypothetical protein
MVSILEQAGGWQDVMAVNEAQFMSPARFCILLK